MIGRECPSELCSPAYFKVKPGTGITQGPTEAFCPYCAYKADPGNFRTKAQVEYAKQIVFGEATDGVERMIKDAFDLGPSGKKKVGGDFLSIEVSVNRGPKAPIRRPLEEELRRDVTCPRCSLEHAVFGIATWCPDCGSDIFLGHVTKEYEVVKRMLADVENRREKLGARVAARDVENALEDTVSIFEAILRAMTRRRLLSLGSTREEVEEIMRKRIGNRYQSVELAGETAFKELNISLFDSLTVEERDNLKFTFEKRHPITHNLGVVDRKYLERARLGELEGREVRVAAEEVANAIELCLRVFNDIYPKVISANGESG